MVSLENLLILLGILVTAWAMRRAELRKRVEDIVNELRAVVADGERYWTTNLSDDEALIIEIKIKSNLKRISNLIDRLNKHYMSYRSKTMVSFIGFKQSLTDGTFEKRPHQSQPQRLDRISDKFQILEAEVRDGQKFI